MVEKKPILVVLAIQMIYAGYFLVTKLAFDGGMNTFVFVFYRQAAATLFLAPVAFFFQWKTAPPLSSSIFVKIFMLALLGMAISLNIAAVALKYTSPSLGAATSNTLPVVTFFLAVLLRMEKVNLKTIPGIMKIGGVLLCMGGVAIIAFYRGPILQLLLHHHLINSYVPQIQRQVPSSRTWIKGVFLMLLSNVTWASWLVLQGRVLKSYPSKLLFTTLQCFLSTVQSLVVALIFANNPIQWRLGWNVRLLSVLYCGIVVGGLTFYLQAWVIEKKGPVFSAMANPLNMVFTIIISALVLGDIINLGSILGAVVLVGGLYSVLWGKNMEEEREKKACKLTVDAEKSKGEITV